MDEAQSPLLASTWTELNRRKVVRAAITYAIAAWVVLQVAEVTFEPLGIPAWAMTWTVLGAVLGLPIVLVLAWYFDATARGLERDAAAPARAGSARLFAVFVVVLTVAGVAWWLAQVYQPGTDVIGRGDSGPLPNSIAVLPFDDLSPAKDQGWLADGIAEELLDRLAKAEGLKVAARTSSFAFRDKKQDIKEIGRVLGVGLVLEGSVRKAEGVIRVTAQLIDARDGFHVWSKTYEKSDADIFALQDEITTAIAKQLEVTIAKPMAAAAVAPPVTDGRAHELYLEGRQQWRLRTPQSLAQAERLFTEATTLDPKSARAWSGLADTYLLLADYGALPLDEAIRKAEAPAVQAVSLDPRLAEAWASVGLLRMSAGQFDAARRSFEEAIKLDPRYEMARMWLARVHGAEGNFAAQKKTLEEAAALNPLEPVVNVNLAQTLAGTGDIEGARAAIERVLAVLPDNEMLLRTLAGIEADAGAYDRARSLARKAHAQDPAAPANLDVLINVAFVLEDWTEAERLIATLPPATRRYATFRQTLALRQGHGVLDPAFAARIDALRALDRDLLPDERADVALAGYVAHSAGRIDDAIELLTRAAGSRDDLAGNVERLDTASLLAVALRESGNVAEAAQWHAAVETIGGRLLESGMGGSDIEYIRALFAAANERRDEAVAALERAYAAGFRERWLLLYDPRLAPIRTDPRVQALAKRIEADLARMRGGSP